MSNEIHNPHRFFDYMKKAREELHALVKTHPELGALSKRELEVFDHLLSDKTLSQIAEEMYLSYSSIHFHCKNIHRKLQLSGRKQLLMQYKDFYEV